MASASQLWLELLGSWGYPFVASGGSSGSEVALGARGKGRAFVRKRRT